MGDRYFPPRHAQAEYMRRLLTDIMFAVLLAFVVCGSLIFELVRLLFPPEAPEAPNT